MVASFIVSQQCFFGASTRHSDEFLSSFTTIKTVMNNLYDGLTEVLMCLLDNANTSKNVLQYLAEVINRNSSRAKLQVYFFSMLKRTPWLHFSWCSWEFNLNTMSTSSLTCCYMWFWLQFNPLSCASSGTFVNLSAVLLRLCAPFLDAGLTKNDKINPKYVFYSNRLEMR